MEVLGAEMDLQSLLFFEVKKEIPAYAMFEESFRRNYTSNRRTGRCFYEQ